MRGWRRHLRAGVVSSRKNALPGAGTHFATSLLVLKTLLPGCLFFSFCALAACTDQVVDPGPSVPADDAKPTASSSTAKTPADPDDDTTSGEALPTFPEDPDDAPPMKPALECGKQLTVILTVGVPGLSKVKTNGCWKPVITDGAATTSFRKCSTTAFKVTNNPTAPNWAYDDTNPTHNAQKEQAFFDACSKGATGDGYVFMAYNGGWRLTSAPGVTVKAYFAELYTSAMTDIDSHYAQKGVYVNNSTLSKRTDVYPMINFGPPASAKLEKKIGAETAKLCATVKDGGYFGLYNADWQNSMPADDPRLLAVEQALDACTAKKD